MTRGGIIVEYVKLPKIEAARVLGIAPRTVDRMIERGDLKTEREPYGRRRILVLIPSDKAARALQPDGPETATEAALRERVRSLEELADFHREQLQLAEGRYQDLSESRRELSQMLRSAQDLNERLTLALPAPRSRPWWKFWQ